MTAARKCSECGAVSETDSEQCWLCGGKILTSNLAPVESALGTQQFSIASLMLTITLCGVLFGIISLAPGIGIALAIIVTPAFLRATVIASRSKASGTQFGTGRKVIAFLSSLGLILAVLLSAGLAFYITCWGGFLLGTAVSSEGGYGSIDTGFRFGIVLGVLGQIIFTCFFIRWLWKRRIEERNRLGDIGFTFSWISFAMIYSISLSLLFRHGYVERGLGWICFIPAAIGEVLSLIALGQSKRSMASMGVGLGLSAMMVSVMYSTSGSSMSAAVHDKTPLATAMFVGLFLSAGVSAGCYFFLSRKSVQAESSSKQE